MKERLMHKLIYTVDAKKDIQNILAYIMDNLNNSSAAYRLLDKFNHALSILQSQPYIGVKLKNIRPLKREYRSYLVKNYIIYYYIEGEMVIIYRVLYAKSNLDSVLLQ